MLAQSSVALSAAAILLAGPLGSEWAGDWWFVAFVCILPSFRAVGRKSCR